MTIYTQYRLKKIPKDMFTKKELFDIVREKTSVEKETKNWLKVKYRISFFDVLRPSAAWIVVIESKGSNYQMVAESKLHPAGRGIDPHALSHQEGWHLLQAVEVVIKKKMKEKERALALGKGTSR